MECKSIEFSTSLYFAYTRIRKEELRKKLHSENANMCKLFKEIEEKWS